MLQIIAWFTHLILFIASLTGFVISLITAPSAGEIDVYHYLIILAFLGLTAYSAESMYYLMDSDDERPTNPEV